MAFARVKRTRAFFEDDGGFSTAGMALALLLALSLTFASVQVCRVQSACADVQNVADACALAAENQVAAYYLVSQVCDSVVLSLTVTGVLSAAAGIVALCIPPAQPAGDALLKASSRLMKARNNFSKSVSSGLNRLQSILPFVSAVQAARVASANNSQASAYLGVAVLVPLDGLPVNELSEDAAEEFADKAQQDSENVKEAARVAEEAAQEADRHKLLAFQADCGANPDYCMYERAASLAGMSGSENPLYSNVDAWSFSVALGRAQAYYPRRLAQESPSNDSVEEIASSELRKHFYAYASDLLVRGYVHDEPGHFEAYFPLLPKNTSEMRDTNLYTQAVYPITVLEDGMAVMHAWPGCPMVEELGSIGVGSIAQHEAEGMPTCDLCEFSASRVGKIAAASTSTTSGFEHYYRIVAQEATAYQDERNKADQAAQQARRPIDDLFDRLADVLDQAASARIAANPPGRVGAVSIVMDTKGVSVASLAPSSFVTESGTLGTRAAIAAATLAQDNPDESANAISSLFDGLAARMPGLGSFPSAIAQIWGHALMAYGNGQQAVESAVENVLNGIPLVGASGLGSWAAGKLRSSIKKAGLEPAELAAWKPVLVNTYHVASQDQGSFAQGLVNAKSAYAGIRGRATGNPLSALVGAVGGQAVSALEGLEQDFVIARIELFGEGGPGVDIRIALPPAVTQGAIGLVDGMVESIQDAIGAQEAMRRWE